MRLRLIFGDGTPLEIFPVESIRIVSYDGVSGLYMLATNTFGNALVYQNNVKYFTVTQ